MAQPKRTNGEWRSHRSPNSTLNCCRSRGTPTGVGRRRRLTSATPAGPTSSAQARRSWACTASCSIRVTTWERVFGSTPPSHASSWHLSCPCPEDWAYRFKRSEVGLKWSLRPCDQATRQTEQGDRHDVTLDNSSCTRHPRKHATAGSRSQRALVAVLVTLGCSCATLVSSSAPASATIIEPVSCSKPFGYYNIGNLQTTLRSMPAGYTRAIYLYKSTSYGPQYQGVMDWATSNNNYGWEQGGPNVPASFASTYRRTDTAGTSSRSRCGHRTDRLMAVGHERLLAVGRCRTATAGPSRAGRSRSDVRTHTVVTSEAARPRDVPPGNRVPGDGAARRPNRPSPTARPATPGTCNGHGTSMTRPPPSAGVHRRPCAHADQP